MRFEETQTFRSTWTWYLVVAVDICTIIPLVYGWIQQVFYGIPLGSPPNSDVVLSLGVLLALIVLTGVTWLIYASSLYSRVDIEGVHVSFYPFFRFEKHFIWEDIQSVEVRQYRPLAEYGGWGLRTGGFNKSGKAYNISGNKGLQLIFTDGSKLLIGTQRPEELDLCLKELCRQ